LRIGTDTIFDNWLLSGQKIPTKNKNGELVYGSQQCICVKRG
jgi:hypothetical protein